MTNRSEKRPGEERIAALIRNLPEVKADEGFRDRLRSEFSKGAFGAAEAPATDTAPPSRPRWWMWVAPAAAVLVAALILVNRGPAASVLEVTGEVRNLSGDAPRIVQPGQNLAAGSKIEVPENGSLDLIVRGTALYELAGGTRMSLPASPGKWFNRAVSCTLSAGEIRLITGPNFSGSELRVFTPEGIVEVTGTLLSIQASSMGTCVCVVEGTARVGVDEEDLQEVSSGFRKIMLRDGTLEIIPLMPEHRDGVLEFDRRHGSSMKKQ